MMEKTKLTHGRWPQFLTLLATRKFSAMMWFKAPTKVIKFLIRDKVENIRLSLEEIVTRNAPSSSVTDKTEMMARKRN